MHAPGPQYSYREGCRAPHNSTGLVRIKWFLVSVHQSSPLVQSSDCRQPEELIGFKQNITSAYHPQLNGLDECFNQTLKAQLPKIVIEHQDDWDDLLDNILFAYWTTHQASTKCTPLYWCFAKKLNYPLTWHKWSIQKSTAQKLSFSKKYKSLHMIKLIRTSRKHMRGKNLSTVPQTKAMTWTQQKKKEPKWDTAKE